MAESAGNSSTDILRSPNVTLTLLGLSTAVLLASLGTSISNVALPTLAQTFQASFQQVQWIVLAYLLAITTLVVSVGQMGDLFGRRRLLISGLLIFTAASFACGLAPNLWILVIARAMQGFGAAIMMTLAIAFVGETIPKDRTGRAMGLLGTMSAVGTALGPTLSGALIGFAGWPFIYFINIPFGLAAVVILTRTLPCDASPNIGSRNPFDIYGTILLVTLLVTYSLSMTISRSGIGVDGLGLLILSAVILLAFVRLELRSISPLINPRLFRANSLGERLLMSAIVTTVVMATLVVGPFYLSQSLGLDAVSVGAAMSCGPLVAALTGLPAGKLVDTYGTRRVLLSGLVLAAAGCTSMSLAPANFGILGYILPLVVITAGYAIFQAANNTSVMSEITSDRRGTISGMLNLSRNLGLITGASTMGAIYTWGRSMASDGATEAAAATNGMRFTFLIAAVLILVSIGLEMRRKLETEVNRSEM